MSINKNYKLKLDKRMYTRVFKACTALCTVQSLNIIWQLSTGSGQLFRQ